MRRPTTYGSIFGAALIMLAVGVEPTPASRAQPRPDAYIVIVHPSNPLRVAERSLLRDVFLKTVEYWPNGTRAAPVDLDSNSPVREEFSRIVLGRRVRAVKSYWHQRLFSGVAIPPPELSSDAAVIRYVMTHPGAVGYVSASADVSRVRVLTVR